MWSFREVSSREVKVLPVFFEDIVSVSSENSGTDSLFDSEITNNFSHWMFSFGFLFLEFHGETSFRDIFVSGNNGVSTIMSLTLSHNDWGLDEFKIEGRLDPVSVHVRDSSDKELLSTW
jgi:hypothetical protein